MAKEAMVTRTFRTSVATVMCMDIEAEQPVTIEAVLPREYKTEKDLIKAAKKAIETETLKVVKVKNVTIKETIYGMPESKFLAYADIVTRGAHKDEE